MEIKVSVKRVGKGRKTFLVKVFVKSNEPVVEEKWSEGIQRMPFFSTGGELFDASFLVDNPGAYTVYVRTVDGWETVKAIEIKKNTGLRKEIIAVVCILAAAACLVVAGSYISSQRSHTPSKPPASSASSQPGSSSQPDKLSDSGGSAIDGAYQGKSQAETLSELKKEQVLVTDSLSSSINFASGQKGTSGSWMMENASKNNVIMQAEIVLDGQVIATSAPVRPGQHIENITLDRNISTGTGKAIAYISYYDLQSQEYAGKAGYQISVVVQ